MTFNKENNKFFSFLLLDWYSWIYFYSWVVVALDLFILWKYFYTEFSLLRFFPTMDLFLLCLPTLDLYIIWIYFFSERLFPSLIWFPLRICTYTWPSPTLNFSFYVATLDLFIFWIYFFCAIVPSLGLFPCRQKKVMLNLYIFSRFIPIFDFFSFEFFSILYLFLFDACS